MIDAGLDPRAEFERLTSEVGNRRWIVTGLDRSNPDPAAGFRRLQVRESTAAAGLSVGELLYTWSRIDPTVIKAVSFATPGASIDGRFDFIRYVTGHFDSMSPTGQAHEVSRLVGYVGEQRYFDLMTSHGHTVTRALTSNQPAWDFYVDHHPVNVKTYADVSTLHGTAAAHPGITYAVPSDATGHLMDNMDRVSGLSHDQAVAELHNAILSAKGDTAAAAFAHHLPIMTMGIAVFRGAAAVRAGQQLGTAVHFGLIDVSLKSAGGIGGALMMGAVGAALFNPVGILVCVAGGAFGGVLAGGELAKKVKAVPLNRARSQLELDLRNYWLSAKHPEHLQERLEQELSDRRITWSKWEEAAQEVRASEDWKAGQASEGGKLTVLLSHLSLRALEAAKDDSHGILELLSRKDEPDGTAQIALGALLINCPELADLVEAGPGLRETATSSQRQALIQREKVFVGTTPHATARSIVVQAGRGIAVSHIKVHDTFHDPSSAPDRELHSSCLKFDLALAESRAELVRLRSSPKRTARKGAEQVVTIFQREQDLGLVLGGLMSRPIACSACGDDVLAAHRLAVEESFKVRPGWHVDFDSEVWRCDEHDVAGCSECPSGRD